MKRFFCECCGLELGPSIINVIGNHTVCDDDDCIKTANWYISNIEGNPRVIGNPTMADVHLD